jgi:hypothetical protein
VFAVAVFVQVRLILLVLVVAVLEPGKVVADKELSKVLSIQVVTGRVKAALPLLQVDELRLEVSKKKVDPPAVVL